MQLISAALYITNDKCLHHPQGLVMCFWKTAPHQPCRRLMAQRFPDPTL
jgi:hypothetical protein